MNGCVVCVVPAFNAEPTIDMVVTALRREVRNAFVLGVDDGSTDGTRARLRRTCDQTIEFDQNRGKGAALRAAFSAATNCADAGEPHAVLTIDADGQHDPAFAPRLIDRLAVGDVVIGARQINTVAVPPHRRLANVLSSAATRAVTRCPIADSQSGYRAIKTHVLRSVDARGDRYEFETDFLLRASRAGFTIVDVPVPTIYGPPSHFRVVRDAWRVTRTLWSHRSAVFRA
jgi:glycosyltransferase involved in cell wall biosynthesis